MLLLAKLGLNETQTFSVYVEYRFAWLALVQHDLQLVTEIDESDVPMVQLSCKQTVHLCNKRLRAGANTAGGSSQGSSGGGGGSGSTAAEPRATEGQLYKLSQTVQIIEAKVAAIPKMEYSPTPCSLELVEELTKPTPADELHYLFERFKRTDDVNHLAGEERRLGLEDGGRAVRRHVLDAHGAGVRHDVRLLRGEEVVVAHVRDVRCRVRRPRAELGARGREEGGSEGRRGERGHEGESI